MVDGGGGTTESDVIIGGSSQNYVESVSSLVFDKLIDELLIEILIRLPLKPANLCKCVSTRFRSLISSSYFVRCYVNYHHLDKSFAVYYALINKIHPPIIFMDIAFTEPPGCSLSLSACFVQQNRESLLYMASNNGLVLCRADLGYVVCNPLTKQRVALPPPPSNAETVYDGFIRKPLVYVGFICKPQYFCESEMRSKTSFKVVQLEIVNCEPGQLSNTLKLETFCSVSGRWTQEYFMSSSTSDHELFCGFDPVCPRSNVVACDGLLHWCGISNRGIFTYDPYNGECRTIKLPHVIRKPNLWTTKHCLGECCGRLIYAYFFSDDRNYRVWELKDYGNGGEWLLLHNVHLDEMKSMVQTIDKKHMWMLFPHPLNQDVVFFWCFESSQIVEYNIGNKLLQLPCFHQECKRYRISTHTIFPFVLPRWPTALPLI